MNTTIKAHDINTFCETFGISRSFFYKLKRQNKAPRTMKVGSKTLISVDAAEEWQKQMEQESASF